MFTFIPTLRRHRMAFAKPLALQTPARHHGLGMASGKGRERRPLLGCPIHAQATAWKAALK